MTKQMFKLQVALPMPPTSNHIYINQRGGGRVKTNEARSWQNRAVKEIMRSTGLAMQTGFDPTCRYWLDLCFYFEEVTNKGWSEFYTRGPKKGLRKAETKWKKIDLSNRLKLLEDTLKIAVGVDDSATFVLHLIKECDPERPRVEVSLFSITED